MIKFTPEDLEMLEEANTGGFVLAVNATTEPDRHATASGLERRGVLELRGVSSSRGVRRFVYQLTEEGREAARIVCSP